MALTSIMEENYHDYEAPNVILIEKQKNLLEGSDISNKYKTEFDKARNEL